MPMPPTEPLIYRLYEIVQNYGYAYKAVLNEKFGDGIMSAIAFSTFVEKEVDEQGVTWVNIKLRGKWYVSSSLFGLHFWHLCDYLSPLSHAPYCSPGVLYFLEGSC